MSTNHDRKVSLLSQFQCYSRSRTNDGVSEYENHEALNQLGLNIDTIRHESIC